LKIEPVLGLLPQNPAQCRDNPQFVPKRLLLARGPAETRWLPNRDFLNLG
jgi:hypothetical protein